MLKLIDKYIIKKFLSTFIVALGLFTLIIVIFDVSEKLDEFVEVMLGKGEIAAGKNRDNLLNVQLIKLTPFSNNAEFKKQIEYYILQTF